tara:strand:- start:38 stop:253 length:216 start_codon:yes stop_codon:yes gene_type:complete
MASELLTFTKDRLARLKDAYASAIASGEQSFQFDGYDFLVGYAKHLIEDLEDHFEKPKKTKQVYRFSGNSM